MIGLWNRSFNSGFSLIELLVVTLLVSISTILLMPALIGARSKARETACMGTLRQWGIGYVLYSQDHDGAVPWEGSREEPDRADAWYNSVAVTLSIDGWTALRRCGREVRAGLLDSMYVCPAAPKRPDVRPYWGYGMNYMLINTRGAYGLPARSKRRLSSIPRLGQTVFMTDKGATPDLLQSHPTANPHYDFKSYWHRGGSNVLFGDGHCAWHPGSRLLDAFQTRSQALDPDIIWVPDAQFR